MRKNILPFLLIIGLTSWIYYPSLRGGWISDDLWYLSLNPLMHGWIGLWKYWFQPGSWIEYYPLQETLQWLQWQMFGQNTLGYHLTNVVFHLVNCLLLWWFFKKLGLRFAWFGALIFAVHPVQVESVSYIVEFKNTLSLPFFILSMGAWIDYEDKKSRFDYWKSVTLFLVAMLCKISMLPFPGLILLYAWWKRGKIGWSDLKATLPFVLIVIALSSMTMWTAQLYVQNHRAIVPGTPLTGLLSRLDAAGMISSVYFARCFVPVDILYVHPQWPLSPSSPQQYLPWLGWIGLTCLLWKNRRSWGRHALLALGFFFLFLSPFLGFISASYMSFTWVMDHLLYIPIIGIIGLFIAWMEQLVREIPARLASLPIGIMAGLVLLMTLESHAFAGLFINQEVFWSHVLQRAPNTWLAHDNLGTYFLVQKRYPEALEQMNEAIALRPDAADDYFVRGQVLDKMGRTSEAIEQYRQAQRLKPNDPDLYINLGAIFQRNGNISEAETMFRQGLNIDPGNGSLCNNLGNILVQSRRIPEAMVLYRQALLVTPDDAELHNNLANALTASGKIREAAEELQRVVAIDPSLVSGHENLGITYARLGRLPEAIEQLETALRLNPQMGPGHDNLAFALAQSGRLDEAAQQFNLALQLDPHDETARASLTKLQQFQLQQGASGRK